MECFRDGTQHSQAAVLRAHHAGLQVGKVECNVCHESYSTSIHKLTEAIDVYSDWIDACEEANNRE